MFTKSAKVIYIFRPTSVFTTIVYIEAIVVVVKRFGTNPVGKTVQVSTWLVPINEVIVKESLGCKVGGDLN